MLQLHSGKYLGGLIARTARINIYLTNTMTNRAVICGLATKQIYAAKPKLQDYHRALYELTNDVEARELNKRIFSMWGGGGGYEGSDRNIV